MPGTRPGMTTESASRRVEAALACQLLRVEPEHLAGAFLGVEPEEALVRIGALDRLSSAADLAQQTTIGRQVAAGLRENAPDDRKPVGAAGERELWLVPAFRRQRA